MIFMDLSLVCACVYLCAYVCAYVCVYGDLDGMIEYLETSLFCCCFFVVVTVVSSSVRLSTVTCHPLSVICHISYVRLFS